MSSPDDGVQSTEAPRRDGPRQPTVAAIVLNWNGGSETGECLASLASVRDVPLHVVLADNGSTDGSLEALAAAHPDVTTLALGTNLGFAAGNNRALELVFADPSIEWACLVNSDLLATPDLFRLLLEGVAAHAARGGRPVGAVGPCLLYRDRPDVIWACGGRVGPALNTTQLIDHGKAHVPARARPAEVDYLPGACLAISRRAWLEVGGLEESFFCYLEDADWGLRLAAAGMVSLVVPSALAFHGLSSSTGGGYTAGRKYMTAVNSVHFLRRHGSWQGWAGLLVFDLMLWPLALLRALLVGRAPAAVAKLRGVLDGLRGVRVDASVAARYARRQP